MSSTGGNQHEDQGDRVEVAQVVRAHYRAQSMPDAAARRILSHTHAHMRGERRWVGRLAAAVALVAIAFSALYVMLDRRDLTEGVLREVVVNHLEIHDADVQASSYAAVVGSLDRLSLPAAMPNSLVSFDTGDHPLGGRYCSVQGNLAAKFTLRDPDSGTPVSLFATPRTPKLDRLGELRTEREGMQLRLWTEGDVFYALVRQG